MQDEINEKVVALSVKGAKLTAEMLQKAIKAMLAQAKKQQEKQPHGKQTLKQLAKQKQNKGEVPGMSCPNVKECACPKKTCPNNGRCCACVIKHRETDSLPYCLFLDNDGDKSVKNYYQKLKMRFENESETAEH